ncbi:NAD(P)-dependent oxidoreductase [Candidatus Obscuribacterales bacterium]|nr:NAD(P)-dependent oxidoreductase [Candidatus Obscuribacterales bacterium]
MSLKDKVIVITGASRGIGHAIAVRAAQDGAKVAILAKTADANPKLPGTIHTAADDVKTAGGQALAIQCDIRFEDQVAAAITKVVTDFGGIDVLVNNASAISLTGTLATDLKRYRLMHEINVGGTFLMSRLALPHLLKATNPHILNMSPPLNMDKKWFKNHVAYTMAKYGMSMCTLGMAEEFADKGVGVNSLWPETAIATAAVRNLLGGDDTVKGCRLPAIVADAAYWILTQPAKDTNGNFFIDSEVLKKSGVTDFAKYAVDPTQPLHRDYFLD